MATKRTRKTAPATEAEIQADVDAGYMEHIEEMKAKKGERPPCLCGCGEIPASKKAKYRPGHDARHHAALRAAGKKVSYVTDDEKRAAHAESLRARRAAKRVENERLTEEALERVGVTPEVGKPRAAARRTRKPAAP